MITPKTKTVGCVSLNRVVASILNKRNDYSKQGKMRLLQFAIEGCREIRLHHIPSMEVEWVSVNKDIMSVPLPDQMMEFKAVGIPTDQGFWEFTEDNDTVNPTLLNKKGNEKEGIVKPPYPVSGFTTPGAENEFKYSHDVKKRRLILYTEREIDEVVIVYKSSGVKSDGETFIPAHAFRALRSYIEYEDIEDDDSVAQSKKDAKLRTKQMDFINMRDAENRFTINQFLDAIYHGIGQTVKR